MTLIIDTSKTDFMIVSLDLDKKTYRKKIKAPQQQSEKLLIAIEALLQRHAVSFRDLKKIKVQSEGSGFTALRIGVLTANALAYALKLPVEALNGDPAVSFKGGKTVVPSYDSEPNIGQAKPVAC